MTYTEAAIEVLRREGKPLHFSKIAEIAIRDGLLDHVGKIPEETMGGQLAAHCRLPRGERHLLVVQAGTFALSEWDLEEDPAGLDGIVEPPPENEPPLRPRERHPIPSREVARTVGRGEPRGRRREEAGERRAKRFPPPAEVAYEILAGADRALSLTEIAAMGAERLLMPDVFVRDSGSLGAALLEDNRRRESAGRKALFGVEGEMVALAAQPEPGERAVPPPAPTRVASPADMRRAGLSHLRRRLRECSGPTVERLSAQLLERMGLKDLKVAKRGRDHVVYTGRRRMGLGDVRHCARVLRSSADVSRRDVSEVRRDLGHYGAQIGVLISAGEAGREGRGEAAAAGQLPVLLLCGEALAEAFAEVGLGCRLVAVPEVDEEAFKAAAEIAEKEEAARRARREERERRERPERGERGGEGPAAPPEEGAPDLAAEAAGAPVPEGPPGEPEEPEGEAEEGEDEAAETAETAPGGAPTAAGEGEGRRRRRRRRRRGGRGRGRAAGGGPPTEAGGAAPVEGAAVPAAGEGGVQQPAASEPPGPPPAAGGEGGARG